MLNYRMLGEDEKLRPGEKLRYEMDGTPIAVVVEDVFEVIARAREVKVFEESLFSSVDIWARRPEECREDPLGR